MAQSISLSRTGGVLPDGVYKLRILEAEVKEGKKGDYLAMKLSADGYTQNFFDNVSFVPGARFRLEPFLDAAGVPTTGNMTYGRLLAFLRNKAVYAELGNETYEGKVKNKVVNYLTAEQAQKLGTVKQAEVSHDPEDSEEETTRHNYTDEEAGFPDDDDDDETKDAPIHGDGLPF